MPKKLKRRQIQSNITQGRLEGILEQNDFGLPIADLTPAAMRVLEARYLFRDENGKVIETPRQMFERVARAVAAVEMKWSRNQKNAIPFRDDVGRKFFNLMASLKFLPNSPTLMNAGKPRGQLSACFVLPIQDQLGSVFETLKDAAIIHKTGGGTGFSFGRLRAKGDPISRSGGTASGPIAFLRIFDMATGTVKQGGIRRGANMAVLPISHPDIEEFISCKSKGGIENFNISVGVTDLFMRALENNSSWSLISPKDGTIKKTIRARVLWKKIAQAAWISGDPGVVFLDRINEVNPTPEVGPMESTNPCGEQPLLPYESCNLGSLNLLAYANNDDLNWTELEKDIELAVRFLDNVIEANSYPLMAVEEITMHNRKIGLGIMGWADLLMRWNIPYESNLALRRAETVMSRVQKIAIRSSEALAKERGSFPGFAHSRWAKLGNLPRRNATVTTIAPTGTISIIAGVSSGIEPVFSLAFERIALEGERLVFIHPELKQVLSKNGVRSRKILSKILDTGSVQGVGELGVKDRKILRTASEIHPVFHVKMQAAFQKFCENGVSKTINLPFSSKVSDVQKIYNSAFKLGCKGITVFRDRSKEKQVLSRGLSSHVDKKKDVLDAVEWLLDDGNTDKATSRKRFSVGLANLSRAHLKQQGK